MKKLIALCVSGLFVVALAAGCAQTSSEATGDHSEAASTETAGGAMGDMGMMDITVEKAGEIGKISVAIEQAPDKTAMILEEHGMTEENLKAAMMAIAESEELTQAYEAARKMAMEAH